MARSLHEITALEKSRHESRIDAARLKIRIREHELVKGQIRMNTGEPRSADGMP
jgi:hypothetical protein